MIKPRGSIEVNATVKKAPAYILEPQIEIAAWCPDDMAKSPPEQVHFLIHWPIGLALPPIVVRFTSPDTLGFIIEELNRYRNVVWPNANPVNLDASDGVDK